MAYDLHIGPLSFPTLLEGASEAVGDALETVGAGVVPSGRRARSFKLALPIHGEKSDDDPYGAGERLRRQVRAFMNNAPARLRGQYVSFAADQQLDGWYVFGDGELEYADGGPSISEYRLTLSDAYRIATRKSHWEGRRYEVYDRTSSEVPRDFYGRVFNSAFSDYATNRSQPFLTLDDPTLQDSEDLILSGRSLLTGAPGTTASTPIESATTVPLSVVQHAWVSDGAVLHLVRFSTDPLLSPHYIRHLRDGGVRIYDTQGADPGSSAPTTNEEELDPQLVNWERVLGPDQPLTQGNIPVMDNRFCRVRWTLGNTNVDEAPYVCWVDTPSGSGSSRLYTNRFAVYFLTGTAPTRITGTLLDTSVLEWTQERAVIRILFGTDQAGGYPIEVIVTLQEGWAGPRFEVFSMASVAHGLAIRVVLPNGSGTRTYNTHSGSAADPAPGTVLETIASTERPFAHLKHGTPGVLLMTPIVRTDTPYHQFTVGATADGHAYAGGSNPTVDLVLPDGSTSDPTRRTLQLHTFYQTTFDDTNGTTTYDSTTGNLWRSHLWDVRPSFVVVAK